MKFSMPEKEKMWPFNSGDCLIEVTTWAGFTVYYKNDKTMFYVYLIIAERYSPWE